MFLVIWVAKATSWIISTANGTVAARELCPGREGTDGGRQGGRDPGDHLQSAGYAEKSPLRRVSLKPLAPARAAITAAD